MKSTSSKSSSALPGGIDHGLVVWFLIGSLLGGLLFVSRFWIEPTLVPVEPFSGLPTDNQAAYDAYLNGVDHGSDGDHDRSVDQFARAVEADPEFAVAWAALSQAHSAMYFDETDPTEQRLVLARDAVDRAFQLDSDLPEAHLALGYYYYRGPRDYERALEELAIAEPGFPRDTNLLRTQAFMYRSMGEWNAARFTLERAMELEPEDAGLVEQQALTQLVQRNYAAADRLLDRSLVLDPELETARIHKAMIPLYRDGDATALRSAAETSLGSGRPWMAWLAGFIQRDYRGARQTLDDTARDTLIWRGGYLPKSLAYGLTQHWAGNLEVAQLHFEAAREPLEQDLETDRENADLHIALGETLAHLGAYESAIRMALRVANVLPASKGAFSGPRYRLAGAAVLIAAGDYTAAVTELESYLSSPGEYSLQGILADPRFDAIRDDSQFQQLVEDYR